MKLKKTLKFYHIEVKAKATSSSHIKEGSIPSIKLLKLELTIFDGEILKWQEFWDSFDATVHKSPSLQGVDKLSYLKGLLKNEAKDVVSLLKLTGNN